MYWDTHLHCYFSTDSQAKPEDMVEAAIDKGLKGICFTDHMEHEYASGKPFTFDPDTYFNELRILQEKYQNILPICIGVELGIQPHLIESYEQMVTNYAFDQVIASSHTVHGRDPYYPVFFENRTEEEARREYFLATLKNLEIFDDFDIYGHIDYVVRYGPNQNKNFRYENYQDILDQIFRVLIEKGKGIEINMAGYKYGLNQPNPSIAMIKRYRELGGKIIVIGSDAHEPEYVAYEFSRLKEILQYTGFTHYTVFQKRQPVFYKVP